MKAFIIDFSILVFLFIFVYSLYTILLKLFNEDFKNYLTNSERVGLFNLKLFSYLVIVYIFYKNDILSFDAIFFTSDRVKHFFFYPIVTKIIYSLIVYFIAKNFIFLISAFNNFQKLTFSKPNTLINNYIKVINFSIFISGLILIISIWMEIKVISLVAGLSTASAVFALIFRDFILGVITSITSANSNLARIGDYITVPKHNIKGVITDVSITSVKIVVDDGDVVSFPSYWLINEVIKNSWLSHETHSKNIELLVYVKISSLQSIHLYSIEQLISKHSCFNSNKEIVIGYNNGKYNIGSINLNFFIFLVSDKEIEEFKLNVYSEISKYLADEGLLYEHEYH